MSSEVTASGMIVGSGNGVVAGNASDWKAFSDISDVTGSGREAGAGAGADLQKDRLRVDDSPTVTLDRSFGV